MIAGVGTFALELILKGLGVFGSYNPVVIAMTIMMFCMMMAMIRYGYFGSLQAAVDNAFNHGKEGLIILDAENKIISVKINYIYIGTLCFIPGVCLLNFCRRENSMNCLA